MEHLIATSISATILVQNYACYSFRSNYCDFFQASCVSRGKLFSPTKNVFAVQSWCARIGDTFPKDPDFVVFTILGILRFPENGCSKRDWECQGDCESRIGAHHLTEMYFVPICDSLSPDRVDTFPSTKNLFPKFSDSIGNMGGLSCHFWIVTYSLLKKYPEWMLWQTATRQGRVIDGRMLENAEIRSFCQRKWTKTM